MTPTPRADACAVSQATRGAGGSRRGVRPGLGGALGGGLGASDCWWAPVERDRGTLSWAGPGGGLGARQLQRGPPCPVEGQTQTQWGQTALPRGAEKPGAWGGREGARGWGEAGCLPQHQADRQSTETRSLAPEPPRDAAGHAPEDHATRSPLLVQRGCRGCGGYRGHCSPRPPVQPPPPAPPLPGDGGGASFKCKSSFV